MSRQAQTCAALTLHNRYVFMVPKVLGFYGTRHCSSVVKEGEQMAKIITISLATVKMPSHQALGGHSEPVPPERTAFAERRSAARCFQRRWRCARSNPTCRAPSSWGVLVSSAGRVRDHRYSASPDR